MDEAAQADVAVRQRVYELLLAGSIDNALQELQQAYSQKVSVIQLAFACRVSIAMSAMSSLFCAGIRVDMQHSAFWPCHLLPTMITSTKKRAEDARAGSDTGRCDSSFVLSRKVH